MVPKFLLQCPVCGSREVEFKNHLSESCINCNSIWDHKGKLILDPRENMTEGDILIKGWFVDLN